MGAFPLLLAWRLENPQEEDAMPRLSAFFQQPHSEGQAEVNGGQPSKLAPLVYLCLVAVL